MLHLAASIAASQPDPLKPNLAELITGVIAFAVVFAALWRVLLPRITKTLAERTDRIEGEIKRAEEAKAQADRLREQYEALLAEARHEAARLREQAREEGARIKAELQQQGDAERRRIVEAAQVQIEAERRQTIAALRGEMGALAVELAGRIVGEALADEARQRRVVERFLDELEQEPTGEPEATVGR